MSAEPKIEFDCPFCAARLRVAAAKASKKVRCPHCRDVCRAPERAGGIAIKLSAASPGGGTLGGDELSEAGNAGLAHDIVGAQLDWGGVNRQEPLKPVASIETDAPVGKGTATLAPPLTTTAGKKPTRRYQIVGRSGAQTITDTNESPGEALPIGEGPPQPMTPPFVTATRRALDPAWGFWFPVALLAAVVVGRYAGPLAPVGALLGAACMLALPVLHYVFLRLVYRRPVVVAAKVTSVIRFLDWRLIALRWLVDGDSALAQKHRLLLRASTTANHPTTDAHVVLMLPSARAKWPAAIVPWHLAQQMELGLALPRPDDRVSLTTCPKCAGTKRRRVPSIVGAMLVWLVKLAIVANVAATAVIGAMLFGADWMTVIWAGAVAAGVWWLVGRPVARCDACRGLGSVTILSRWTPMGSVVAWTVMMWVLLVPLGWRSHSAFAVLPAYDEAVAFIGLDPAHPLAADADQVALAGKHARLVLATVPTESDRTLAGLGPLAQKYHAAVIEWAAAVDARSLAPTDSTATSRLEAAGAELAAARSAVAPLRSMGEMAPTLWFGPETLGAGQFEAALREVGRYASALWHPTRQAATLLGFDASTE